MEAMVQQSGYQSKIPQGDGTILYTDEENAVWRDLMARQEAVLQERACDTFLAGLAQLNLPRDRVPQLSEVDARLADISGFGLAPVPALISPRRFFSLLAERKFPAATFIRRREEFDYLQEPDVFHEIYGHCPMLTSRAFADFLQRFGEAALSLRPEDIWMLQRLFWFTVEFGLVETTRGLRIYGAGIASSAGESPYSLENDGVERRPLDLVTVLRTPYRIDIFQTVYYVIRDWRQLYDLMSGDIRSAMDQARELGPLAPTYLPPST